MLSRGQSKKYQAVGRLSRKFISEYREGRVEDNFYDRPDKIVLWLALEGVDTTREEVAGILVAADNLVKHRIGASMLSENVSTIQTP